MTISEIENKTGEKLNVQDTDMEKIFSISIDKRNNYVFNLNSTISFPDIDSMPDSSFDYYKVKDGDTWPIISYNVYGTVRLVWLLFKINKITDPFRELIPNSVIMYIPKSNISLVLKAL